MNQTSRRVLIIGKPGTSKTTFIDQFYGQVDLGISQATLRETPASIATIERGRQRLAQGKEVEATPSAETSRVPLKLTVNGQPLNLDLLDYGGEQVRDIIDNRRLPSHWQQLACECDVWIFLVRIHDFQEPHDVTTRPLTEALPFSGEVDAKETHFTAEPTPLNETVTLIELLQILLATRKTSYQQPIHNPSLKLVVTHWDMLGNAEIPEVELKKRHPLLVQFVRSNWAPGACSIWGLSAQGFRLDRVENQEKYLVDGPEVYAQVVLPTGQSVNDLAKLLI